MSFHILSFFLIIEMKLDFPESKKYFTNSIYKDPLNLFIYMFVLRVTGYDLSQKNI